MYLLMTERFDSHNLDRNHSQDPFFSQATLAEMLLADPDACTQSSAERKAVEQSLHEFRPVRSVMRNNKLVAETQAEFSDLATSGMCLLAHEPDHISRSVKLGMIFDDAGIPLNPQLAEIYISGGAGFSSQLQPVMNAESQILPVIIENAPDPNWRYRLIKSIATASFNSSPADSDTADENIIIAMNRPVFRGTTADGPTFLDYLNSELQEGGYDDNLVRDIVTHESQRDTNSAIKQLITFAQSLSPDKSITDVLIAVQDSYIAWPEAAKRLADTTIQDYKEAVAATIHKEQQEIRAIKLDSTKDELLDEFKRELLRFQSLAQSPPPQRKKSQQIKRVKKSPNTITLTPELQHEEIEKTPVSDYTFSIRNDSYTTTTPEELIESKARANDQSLKEGLESMVEYVSTNILKPAKSTGIKPLRAPHLGQKVFEFKPAEAAGFSTKHRQVKATRFIFKILEREDSTKTVAPIDFILRADLDKWIANQA
ncbi:MAG: hypothetical protein EOO88_34830 [Pedobacter sp.]|nr:MAG: hypothetical protein EOO88_34830 [Pedobacter sp.]